MRQDRILHIWLIGLSWTPSALLSACELLPDVEKRRADGFHSDVHRRRFIARRWACRAILAEMSNIAPQDLLFRVSRLGKPFLDNGISFSTSHSGELAMVAVWAAGDIGVDVEELRPFALSDELLRLVLTSDERADLSDAPQADRVARFLRVWVRKEALVKAQGVGIGTGVNELKVWSTACPISQLHDLRTNMTWLLHDLSCPPSHLSSVSFREEPDEIQYHQFLL